MRRQHFKHSIHFRGEGAPAGLLEDVLCTDPGNAVTARLSFDREPRPALSGKLTSYSKVILPLAQKPFS